jgi:hypothetical protein
VQGFKGEVPHLGDQWCRQAGGVWQLAKGEGGRSVSMDSEAAQCCRTRWCIFIQPLRVLASSCFGGGGGQQEAPDKIAPWYVPQCGHHDSGICAGARQHACMWKFVELRDFCDECCHYYYFIRLGLATTAVRITVP